MGYTESLDAIRKAREERDQSKDELYALQMQYLMLSREQKKAAAKDVIEDAATAKQIDALRKEIAELQKKIDEINAQLAKRKSLVARLKELLDTLHALEDELQSLENKIAGIQNELENGELSDEERERLKAQLDELKAQEKAIQDKISALQQEMENVRAQLANTPPAESLEADRRGLQAQIDRLKKQIEVVIAQANPFRPNESERLKALKDEIARKRTETKRRETVVAGNIGDLFRELTPQQLIQQWEDNTPIALLPLRLETKFRQTANGQELLVRIYPDDIAVVTHEKVLTDKEIEFGTALWKTLFAAGDDLQKKRDAWKVVTDKFGVNRATWVGRQTKPLNWDSRGQLQSADDLHFPIFDVTKPDKWTEAPHTKVLPDRFVLLGYRAKEQVLSQISKQVADVVILGPAPVDDGEQPSVTRDPATNRIIYGDDFKWVADFDLAVDSGLGFRVPLQDAEANTGYDQLLVVGLKLSANKTGNQAFFEELLENHRYSIKGLSLIQQGTPTNNTEAEDAGYSQNQSVDDIIAFIEKDQTLFAPVADLKEATDGQRLADYLGINYEVLQTVQNANIFDHKEAVAMNTALYATTLGYYMNSMLNEVLSDEDLIKLRTHCTKYVTGRGPLAALRIGNQPYGIAVTSSFNDWTYSTNNDIVIFRDRFYPTLFKVLQYMSGEWKKKVGELAHITKRGSAGETLMSVLGLNPTSVEYFQRIGYSYDYLKNLDAFGWGGKYFSDVFGMVLESMTVRTLLKNLGYSQKSDDGTLKPWPLLLQIIFQHYHTQLDNKNLIDGEPLSEEHLIKPYDEAANLNYIHWLLANAADEDGLQKQDFGTAAKPHSLLYLMLLNSMILEASHSIFLYFKANNIVANELVRSRKFMNISSAPSVSPWEVFKAPANKLVDTEASTLPLYQYIHSEIPPFTIVSNLAENKWALNVLKDLPTARLERIFAEHIDSLSYRLDAWQTSLFDARLQQQRGITTTNEQRQMGIYLGAYGYLENVRPNNKRIKINEERLPLALREQTDNLFVENGNGGYVQAPTLNHATAAAILRNGYLTHASSADKETLSVNLSSERVRRAKYLLDGVRNGQTLEALLGYQFERGLHDWSTRAVNPVILNQLKPIFRQAFPLKKTKVPQEGKTTGPEEVTNDYHVVNGLDLANVATPFPYGITTFPALSAEQISAIEYEKAQLENTLDAMRDVLTSESAYQLALGNFDRAASVMQAVSNTNITPEIEVIDSARSTNLSFTNRVAVHFDSAFAGNPWPAILLTQKAQTEQGLNHWLGTLLGDPMKVECTVRAVDANGLVLKRADNSDIVRTVTLANLAVQPLDFVLLIRNKLEESGTSELESRIRYFFAQAEDLEDNVIVKIDFSETSNDADLSIRSLREVLPFANYLRELISGSKTLTARDYEPASKVKTASVVDPNNVNVVDLQTRVEQIFSSFETQVAGLTTAVTDAALKTKTTTDALRNKLKEFADAGFVFAFPQSSVGFEDAMIDLLVTQGTSVLKRYADIKIEFNKNLAKVNDASTGPDEKVSLLTSMAKSLLGADYVLLPRFTFNNTLDVAKAYGAKDDLLTYAKDVLKMKLPVNEWLHGASLVRKKMHTLEMVRLLNDGFNDAPLEASPIQLPYRDKDTWLAVEYPEGTTIVHDTLSFVQYTPQGFNAATEQCGLLLDDWTEVIPSKEEVSGIGFNYNQPNSSPPQTILLAVTPEQTGHWQWESLVATILDTVDRAKERAIEPDQLDTIPGLTTLLPAVLAEFSTSAFTHISLDYSFNIKKVFEEATTLYSLQK